MKEQIKNQKLSVLEKSAYGVGDLACNLFWGLIIVATTFYTEYFGLDAGTVGTMILVISIIDILFDVIIGAVADRYKTRWGRFRPWILFGVVPFCIIGFLTFYTPDFDGAAKVFYASVTFFFFRIMYSVVNVPYGALMGVISADPKERDAVSAYRTVGAQIGCLCSYGVVFTVVRTIQDSLNCDGQTGFAWTAFLYAVACLILLLCTFFFTRERVEPVKSENNRLSEDVKDLASNKPWICLSVAGIAMLFFVFVHTGLTTYYAKYYLADFSVDPISGEEVFKVSGTFFGIQMSWELLSSLFLTSATLVTLIGTFLIKGAVAKFGKKPTWIACFVLASIFSIAFALFDKTQIEAIVLLNIAFTVAIGPTGFIMWSMYADVADDAEVKTGRRATGLIYSSATMAQKLGQTLAQAVPAYALLFIGFKANTEMSADMIDSIKNCFAFLPLVGSAIGILALYFYDIDEKKIKENSAKLAELNANKTK